MNLSRQSTIIEGTIISVSPTSISGSFQLSSAPSGVYNLTVSNPVNYSVTRQNAFTILSPGPAPIISGMNPSSGFNSGNLPGTITAMNFNRSTVYLNQGDLLKLAQSTPEKRSSTTVLYITLPIAGIPGGFYNITVQNSDGVNTTAQDIFYLTDKAWINSPSRTKVQSSVIQTPNLPIKERPIPNVLISGPPGRKVI